jgi:hypothetical protein
MTLLFSVWPSGTHPKKGGRKSMASENKIVTIEVSAAATQFIEDMAEVIQGAAVVLTTRGENRGVLLSLHDFEFLRAAAGLAKDPKRLFEMINAPPTQDLEVELEDLEAARG